MPVEASGPDADATIPGWTRASLFGEDTETLFTKDPSDQPGLHVRLFGSHEFFRLWLVQVVSATGDWLGFSAIILLAATIGGGAGAGAISLVMAARIVLLRAAEAADEAKRARPRSRRSVRCSGNPSRWPTWPTMRCAGTLSPKSG